MYDKFEEDDSSWSFALGLLVGAVVGAAVASLFAPRSGAQNREAVIERGLVLRDRVTEATDSVTTRVRDTATTVKGQADRLNATAAATAERVQDAATTAAATVKDAATTAADRAQTLASTASEKVQEAANTAAATVSEVAGTVSERAQDVAARVQVAAGAATERARQATGRETADEFELPAAIVSVDEFEAAVSGPTDAIEPAEVDVADVIEAMEADVTVASDTLYDDTPDGGPDTATLAAEARYDAEDIRSAAADDAAEESRDVFGEPEPEQLETLASIDTFEGATGSTTALDGDLASDMLPPPEDEPMDLEVGSGETAVLEAQSELASSEQFEVDEQAAPLGENSQTSDAEDQDRRAV